MNDALKLASVPIVDRGIAWQADATAALKAQAARIAELEAALLRVARMAEALKKPCGMDFESPQAVRNGEYMNLSYFARAALKEKQ
jgi:hypothetical protein